jgi:hypothetical protein
MGFLDLLVMVTQLLALWLVAHLEQLPANWLVRPMLRRRWIGSGWELILII